MTKKQKVENQKDRITQEEDRLLELFKNATDTEKKLALPSIKNLAFMRIQLEELQDEITSKGAIERYDNGGGQKGYKQSTALQSYNNLIKSYNTTLKILAKDIFKNIEPEEKDALQLFMEEHAARRAAYTQDATYNQPNN